MLTKDLMLNDWNILKVGIVLQISAPTTNWHRSTQGKGPQYFDLTWLLNSGQRKSKRTAAYMALGAWWNACPGRYSGSGEILSLAAVRFWSLDRSETQPEIHGGFNNTARQGA